MDQVLVFCIVSIFVGHQLPYPRQSLMRIRSNSQGLCYTRPNGKSAFKNTEEADCGTEIATTNNVVVICLPSGVPGRRQQLGATLKCPSRRAPRWPCASGRERGRHAEKRCYYRDKPDGLRRTFRCHLRSCQLWSRWREASGNLLAISQE